MADWRLDLAENARGVTVSLKRYTQPSKDWDHDHCVACTTKFSETIPGAQREGYATADEAQWICVQCFNDLKAQMGWTVAEGSPRGT
jgi:hypothetical protein